MRGIKLVATSQLDATSSNRLDFLKCCEKLQNKCTLSLSTGVSIG